MPIPAGAGRSAIGSDTVGGGSRGRTSVGAHTFIKPQLTGAAADWPLIRQVEK
jgi:hypothetical protein